MTTFAITKDRKERRVTLTVVTRRLNLREDIRPELAEDLACVLFHHCVYAETGGDVDVSFLIGKDYGTWQVTNDEARTLVADLHDAALEVTAPAGSPGMEDGYNYGCDSWEEEDRLASSFAPTRISPTLLAVAAVDPEPDGGDGGDEEEEDIEDILAPDLGEPVGRVKR